ncbi:MAG TPA: hypothetical protein VGY48_09390 [Vicinamibacterales bacterium]|nr:hypothetical protein [Vicinamibacterales bacterium]
MTRRVRARGTADLLGLFGLFGLFIGGLAAAAPSQIRYAAGQNVVPVFEGWERNADGSFNMVFGYMNRNYEEELDIPVGPNNSIEPGPIDQGQPAHFYARRQQYVFKVHVPKDWGKKDVVWTLTSHGKTEKAYATLMPTWEIDVGTYQQNRGGPGELGEPDEAPTIRLEGAPDRTIAVGASLPLEAFVIDDGKPSDRPSQSGSNPRVEGPLSQAVVRLDRGMRLGVVWVVYRGDAKAVSFQPRKIAVSDGKASTTVRFSAPGVYVLRAYADDGILVSTADVKVTVP